MAHHSDWLPGTRTGSLEMARKWIGTLATKGTAWGVSDAEKAELAALTQAADTALTKAKDESTRTPVATAQCKTAFDALVAFMRDMKKRRFLTPPLVPADYVSLGLKSPDDTKTPTGKPTDQVMVETFLVGRHQLGINIIYETGSKDNPSNKGYRIHYKVVAPGETPPVKPKQLLESFSTRRMKEVMEFDYEDSGKTAYFAVQIENGGKKGSWGTMTSALIP
jgi:hypothetical protein